jgi:quercetin dioxygenase-like cupin family protein
MAHPEAVIENPPMGGKLLFRQTGRETNGELLQFDFYLRPGGTIAREHVHPQQEERFEVISGNVRGRMGGEERTASPGDVVNTPPGLPHVWWNDSDEEVHLLVEFRPALETESFFRIVFGLARDGKANRQGLPKPLQMAVLLAAHPDEFYPAFPPVPVVKAFAFTLAPIGKLFGYRADYPEYTQAQTAAPSGSSTDPIVPGNQE